MHWPLPIVEKPPSHDQEPVLVAIEYPGAADRLDEFHRLIRKLRQMGKRDGAYFGELV